MKKIYESEIKTPKREYFVWLILYPIFFLLVIFLLLYLILNINIYSLVGILLVLLALLIIHVSMVSRVQSSITIYDKEISIFDPKYIMPWKKKEKRIPLDVINYYKREENMIAFFRDNDYRYEFYIMNPNDERRKELDYIENAIQKLKIKKAD